MISECDPHIPVEPTRGTTFDPVNIDRSDCPGCGMTSPLAFSVADINREVSAEQFAYFRCHGCRLIFLDPIPEDLGRYYPDDYYGFSATSEELERVLAPERYKI